MLAIIITAIVIISIIIVAFILLNKLSSKSLSEEEQPNRQDTLRQGSTHSYDLSRNNQINYPNSTQAADETNVDNAMYNQSSNSYNNPSASSRNIENKPLTKKEIKKQEKKKFKEDNREYQRQLLEEKKLREQEKERDYREKEMQREEQRKKEEELLKQLQEQKEKAENELYDKWKDQFKIEDEGVEVSGLESEDMINDFINYIKLRKVVALEDLSGVFKIPPNEIVEKLKFFEAQNKICGIVDDRGKYIYLTEKELASIERIFMQRGRISKMELLKECNKIIRFIPTEEDKLKIKEEQSKIWKTFEEEMSDKNSNNTYPSNNMNSNIKK